MQIVTITYKAIRNRGNYESEHLEATAQIEEGDESPEEAVNRLRRWVNGHLELTWGIPPTYNKPPEHEPGDLPEDF